MIHEEICTDEVCKLAKEKGFPQHPDENGKCRIYTLDKSKNTYVLCDWTVWISASWTSEVIAAPTQSLLQRWLREEKGLYISVEAYPILAIIKKVCFAWVIKSESDGHFMKSNDSHQTFYSYELALEDALKYALEKLV